MNSENLKNIRKNYLESIFNMETPTDLLLELLNQSVAKYPEILEEYISFGENDQINHSSNTWSNQYFYTQKSYASRNFSRIRLEHLLNIREHLQKKGIKGFSPKIQDEKIRELEKNSRTSNYTPSKNLDKFIKEGDLATIRTALRLELNNNKLTSQDLHSALIWVKKCVNGIFDPYSEKTFARGFEKNQQLWSSQYYEQQVVYLKTNFSEERFLHLIEVREKLRELGIEGFETLPENSAESQPRIDNKNHDTDLHLHTTGKPKYHTPPPLNQENPAIKKALMIGGAVAAFVALLIAIVVR